MALDVPSGFCGFAMGVSPDLKVVPSTSISFAFPSNPFWLFLGVVASSLGKRDAGEDSGGGMSGEEERGMELCFKLEGCSSVACARISKLLLVEGIETISCWGFFPVEGFLCARLRLGTLVKTSWAGRLEGSEAEALAFSGQSLKRCL